MRKCWCLLISWVGLKRSKTWWRNTWILNNQLVNHIVLKVQLDRPENEIKFGAGCQARGFRESLSKSRLRHQPISLSSPLTALILTSQISDQLNWLREKNLSRVDSQSKKMWLIKSFCLLKNCSHSYPIYPGSEWVCQGKGFLQITCF